MSNKPVHGSENSNVDRHHRLCNVTAKRKFLYQDTKTSLLQPFLHALNCILEDFGVN